MSSLETEKSFRRRLLAKAMPSGTSEEILTQAIAILDNEFGNTPEIRYGELVKRLRESLDSRSVDLGGLLGKIMMLRNKPAEEIGPDPGGRKPTGGTERPAAGTLRGHHRVFNALFEAILTCIARRGGEQRQKLAMALQTNQPKLQLLRNCDESLSNWIREPDTSPSVFGAPDELQRIINASFVWLCSQFGPVEADKILLHAVNVAEQLPEAFDHSPKQFL